MKSATTGRWWSCWRCKHARGKGEDEDEREEGEGIGLGKEGKEDAEEKGFSMTAAKLAPLSFIRSFLRFD